jgi:hypothetical protein
MLMSPDKESGTNLTHTGMQIIFFHMQNNVDGKVTAVFFSSQGMVASKNIVYSTNVND